MKDLKNSNEHSDLEIWKDVDGYENYYRVSNNGKVLSVIKSKHIILKQRVTKYGYCAVNIRNEQNKRNVSVHRIVAIAFIPNPENKREVNHKDGIKTNNSIENLEWVTRSENCYHSYKTGLRIPTMSGVDRYNSRYMNKK